MLNKYKLVSITKIFNKIKKELGAETFKLLFEIILTDNGWEFSKPEEIEMNSKTNEKIANVFYCVPYSSLQKGGIERNHEFIRYIIPKGISFDSLAEENVEDMVNNINSVSRRSLNDKTPFEIFEEKYGKEKTKNFISNPYPEMKLT